MDFCYRVFELDEHGQASDKLMKEMIEIAIHEMGHILGLTSDDMAFYYDRSTGQPRTIRPLKAAQDIECVDGRKASEFGYEIFAPSKDTLTFGAMFPGIKYFEVVTPTVRQVAQNHFNCKEMRGMRLENQPTSNGKLLMVDLIFTSTKLSPLLTNDIAILVVQIALVTIGKSVLHLTHK